MIMLSLQEQVESVLDQIRPALAQDGGTVRLVAINRDTGLIQVEFQGACATCALSHVTLKLGIEAALRDAFSWVTRVEAVPITTFSVSAYETPLASP